MSDQKSERSRAEGDLRGIGAVALVIGVVLLLGGALYPALTVIGGLIAALGVVLLVAWLVVRAMKR